MSDPLLTVKEAAERLTLAPSTLYAWCFERRIKFVRLGRAVRFRPSDIEELVEMGVQDVQEVSIDIR